jgi:hypothetical protein
MEAFPFDDHDSDAVFGAAAGAPDVPESLRDVADLVHAARRPASADELVGADGMVAEIAAAMGEVAAPALQRGLSRGADERTRVFSKFRTAKLAAAATVALMVGGTAAAAATGALPTAAPSHERVELASSHQASTRDVEAAHHEGDHHDHRGLFGEVASVNGVSDPGTCGAADTAGAFTITDRDGNSWTVNVTTDTEYRGHDATDESFADVCVGSLVKLKGTVDKDTLTVDADKVYVKGPRVHETKHERRGAFGQVDSVNGVSDPGTCGAADTAGTFTLTGFKGESFTVNVDTSTMYAAKDVTDASFANVCVGQLAFAKGGVTGEIVTASAVFIVPPKTEAPESPEQKGVFGEVASVNGVSDSGACGAAGTDGSFTVTDRDGNTWTVNVTADTTFFGKHHWSNNDSSFADVCVGKKAGARGAVTDSTVAADSVFVLDEHNGDHHDCNGRHGHGDGAKFTSDRNNDWGNHDSGSHDGSGHDGASWSGHDSHTDGGGWSHHGHGNA